MKVFPHGQGGGRGPTHYLVRLDYPGRDESPPEILRGDADTTRDLIDSLEIKWRFTAGVLSWHPEDKITPIQEQRVMDDFEQVAFAGLEPDQRNILWVRHRHAGHHELHFVIPRVELYSGKAFNPCPPGWQQHFDVFRDMHNHREGWARPDDPTRARICTPEQADLHNARLRRWGKPPIRDQRAEAKASIHAYVQSAIEQGMVKKRTELLQALTDAGLAISRAGKEYITVTDPEDGGKYRLKGGIYAEQWQYEFFSRKNAGQSGAGQVGSRKPDARTVRELEVQFERIVEKRAQYNRKRYSRATCELGKEREFSLPFAERRLWLEMLAGRSNHRERAYGGSAGRLEPIHAGGEQSLGSTSRDCNTDSAAGQPTSRECQSMVNVQGAGTISGRGQELSADTRRLDNQPQRNAWQARCLANCEEVSHDRNGANAQRVPGIGGATTTKQPDCPLSGSAKALWRAGEPQERNQNPANRTSDLERAHDALERCVRELTTLVGEAECVVARQVSKIKCQLNDVISRTM